MEIQTLKKSKKKPILIGGICAIAVLSVGVLATSRAKYKLTESINIANGVVNYKVPDFQIVAMYKSDDGENYTEIEGRMPDSGYIINEEKSYCNLITGGEDTEAILKTVDSNHVIANLIKGDKCYLYFDKKTTETVDTSLGPIEVQLATPDFSKTAPNDIEGIFAAEDGMYSGTSYYWRGAVTNNYVKFANLCWRIVRINGDGTIRLIYDGTTCHANGTTTAESIAKTSIAYNSSYNNSSYVGWTYTASSQRPSGAGTASNAKTQLESWYSSNITGTNATKVADGKYCNDRNVQSGQTWVATGTAFNYAGYQRLYTNYQPTLSCPSGDVYTLKVGLITADEVELAGGKNQDNKQYYLYNGQYYWTMSPFYWYSGSAVVFCVNAGGSLGGTSVTNNLGLRPVINLKADTLFKEGTNGTQNNPYEVL